MKRALPTEKVAQASKLFEKFHAAEELEDILDYHNELCNVLQIVPGNLKSFYNVIKVRTFFSTPARVQVCECAKLLLISHISAFVKTFPHATIDRILHPHVCAHTKSLSAGYCKQL